MGEDQRQLILHEVASQHPRWAPSHKPPSILRATLAQSSLGVGILVGERESVLQDLGAGKATLVQKENDKPVATLAWESPRGDLRLWIGGQSLCIYIWHIHTCTHSCASSQLSYLVVAMAIAHGAWHGHR